MLIVIALGGNALLQRGEPLEAAIQRRNVELIAKKIADLSEQHQIVICHGNGPQVGLLALQNEAYKKVTAYPLDVLVAESQGMIGYFLQQAIDSYLTDKTVVTLLTQVVVDSNDPAFQNPTKFIGPVYNKEQSEKMAQQLNWTIKPDGKYFRRVVPSPKPQNIVEIDTIKSLLNENHIVVAGGGGGIPVTRDQQKTIGVEAVIDKDNTASKIAEQLNADLLVILTDVEAVYTDWGKPSQQKITNISPESLQAMSFAAGSMGPKIDATTQFVLNTKRRAAIGQLQQLDEVIAGTSGTQIQLT